MSYQNVASCRFYIDYFSYWKSVGLIHALKSYTNNGNKHEGYYIGLNPSLNTTISQDTNLLDPDLSGDSFQVSVDLKQAIPNRALESINFSGVLGTNINQYSQNINSCYAQFTASAMNDLNSAIGDDTLMGNIIPPDTNSDIINAESNVSNWVIGNKGFSLSKTEFESTENYNDLEDGVDRFNFLIKWMNQDTEMNIEDGKSWNLNCLLMGHYYDMPRTPDLNLTMTTEFDGFDQLTTQGGATITNVRYTGNPSWAGSNAWEIIPPNQSSNPYYKRNGRRTWKLKFSYLSDTDIFASNYSTTNWLSNTTNYTTHNEYSNNSDVVSNPNGEGDVFSYTLVDDDSFGAKVLNFIGSGQRFVFQSDNTNNNPDQFAICILDQDSLVVKQTASNVYDVSMKIVEVW